MMSSLLPCVIVICAALLLQAASISWLIYEIGRQHRAEIQSRSAMAKLIRMNRRAAAGLLSASHTHEVNQPLAGMVSGASAGLRWLRADKPHVEKAEAALEAIVAAGHRAGDIVASVRAMFKKEASQKVSTDINQTIRTVLSIVRVELKKHERAKRFRPPADVAPQRRSLTQQDRARIVAGLTVASVSGPCDLERVALRSSMADDAGY